MMRLLFLLLMLFVLSTTDAQTEDFRWITWIADDQYFMVDVVGIRIYSVTNPDEPVLRGFGCSGALDT